MALLNEHVQHLALAVDGPPHEYPFATDANHHLIEMPHAAGTPAFAANIGGDRGTELAGPGSDGLITDVNAALGEQILNVAQARGETEMESHRQADRVRREPMVFVGNGFHSRLSTRRKIARGDKLAFAWQLPFERSRHTCDASRRCRP